VVFGKKKVPRKRKEIIMNNVILMGRLTRDPDIRWTSGYDQTQRCVARFNLAVDRRTTDANGNRQADFISCVAFGKTAEFFERYVHKGTKMAIEGRIQTGSYTDRDNRKVYTTDVVVERAEFAESKRGDSSNNSADSSGGSEPQYTESSVGEGFMNIPEGVEDEGLPFN
jgi:single-strand DNA-binding protein